MAKKKAVDEKAKRPSPTKKCPHCGGLNHPRKRICAHCGKDTGITVKKAAPSKKAVRTRQYKPPTYVSPKPELEVLNGSMQASIDLLRACDWDLDRAFGKLSVVHAVRKAIGE